jgi:hypothetical protein
MWSQNLAVDGLALAEKVYISFKKKRASRFPMIQNKRTTANGSFHRILQHVVERVFCLSGICCHLEPLSFLDNGSGKSSGQKDGFRLF